VNKTTGADPDHRRRPATPAELETAADNVGGVRSRGDVEQQPGKDEKPELMNAKRFNHLFDLFHDPACPKIARVPLWTVWSIIMSRSGFHRIAHFYKHWNRRADHVVVIQPIPAPLGI